MLLVGLLAVFVWSFAGCYDYLTWLLEALPVIIGVSILVWIYRRFRFTNLVYFLIWIFSVILLVGAHYTYARMPLFNWIKDVFELSRNHYDRLGHFVQGFVPAMIAREILLRKTKLERGGWLFFIVVCICLAVSAGYEVFEWIIAAASRDGAVAFLATQGDVWDTQKDMALCFVGAITSLITLQNMHDRMLREK